jgi:CSLREA domain-containing protein
MSFLFVFCLSLTASAAVYTVTKTADTNDGACDNDCSLREAIMAANGTPDNDSIEFSSLFSAPQTITLAGSEIIFIVNGTLTINGPGPELLTISGNNASRIFASSINAVVDINGLRFTAGNGAGATNTGRGGAIYNVGGTMVIRNSVFTGNTAANGGAINNAAWTASTPDVPAVLTIVNCVFTGNSATSSGAAMQNFATSTLNIRNTTISGNTSSNTGISGAIQANGTVTIANTTISGNSAPTGTGAGVYFNGANLNLTNSTIVNNTSGVGGGGLHRTGTNPANIRNTIIANNTGAAGSPDALGAVNSQGNNIIGNTTGSSGWIGSDFQNTNPLLGALAANGGLGQTHLPQTGSPAIDAGQNCVVDLSCAAANPPVALTTDQRGVTRPQNAIVDIGAVEVAAAASATIIGQVLSSELTPVKNAIVTISNQNGVIASARTNGFGYFKMGNIPQGSGYTLNVLAKQYTFAPQNINVTGDITDITITATSGNFAEKKF